MSEQDVHRRLVAKEIKKTVLAFKSKLWTSSKKFLIMLFTF